LIDDRWRSGAAYIAQIASATAIARILKLDDDSIRVGEIKLRGSFSRAASIFHSHAHVRCQGDHGPGGVPPRFHPEISERFENSVEFELVHDPVRICEIKFWRPFLCSPRIFPTYSHPRLERAAPRGKICIKGIEFCYAMRGQHLKNPVYLEIVGGHAEVADAGLCIRPASSQAYVLRA